MNTMNECLACGTMTDDLARLCGEACLNAMYDSIKIETPTCACGNDATHAMQGVGDTLADTCGQCCDGCDERECDYDFNQVKDCGCVGYCAPNDHKPNADGGTAAGLAKLLFG